MLSVLSILSVLSRLSMCVFDVQCFANDVVYNFDVLKNWDEDKIRDYFESGGGGEGAAPSTVVAEGETDPFKIDMPKELQWRMNQEKTVAVMTMNRPNERNAIDDNISTGLMLAIKRIKATPSLRVVFWTGNGAMFCAGGDPKGFQKAQELGKKAAGTGEADLNSEGAGQFATMLKDLDALPVYLVALAQGSAMGGGFGFLSVCDCVIARKAAFFALSEVKLGVIPATISPYVVGKIGASNSRRLFMTGETINAEKAKEIGLVQEVRPSARSLARWWVPRCQPLCRPPQRRAAGSDACHRSARHPPSLRADGWAMPAMRCVVDRASNVPTSAYQRHRLSTCRKTWSRRLKRSATSWPSRRHEPSPLRSLLCEMYSTSPSRRR